MKILIAEDDAVSLAILEKTLRGLGHEVVVAEDGQMAWEEWQKDYFPVVISDWLMPRTDGPALSRMIRRTHRENYTYIIMLTVLEGKSKYLEAMEAGVDDFITKPFDRDELVARLVAAERIVGLRHHVSVLECLLPICSYCKRIRDEKDQWHSVENYVTARFGAKFTHGICPDCFDKHAEPEG